MQKNRSAEGEAALISHWLNQKRGRSIEGLVTSSEVHPREAMTAKVQCRASGRLVLTAQGSRHGSMVGSLDILVGVLLEERSPSDVVYSPRCKAERQAQCCDGLPVSEESQQKDSIERQRKMTMQHYRCHVIGRGVNGEMAQRLERPTGQMGRLEIKIDIIYASWVEDGGKNRVHHGRRHPPSIQMHGNVQTTSEHEKKVNVRLQIRLSSRAGDSVWSIVRRMARKEASTGAHVYRLLARQKTGNRVRYL